MKSMNQQSDSMFHGHRDLCLDVLTGHATAKSGKGLPPVVFGVCWWNHKTIKALFSRSPIKPVLHKSFAPALAEAKRRGGCVIGWASRLGADDEAGCKAAGIPLIRIEDGFLRSVGLGAGLAPATSLVLDGRGIYYDGTRSSDLEWRLEHTDLGGDQIARGADLHRRILKAGLSKYNLGKPIIKDDFPTDRPKVLVPGQVIDDAAILKTMSNTIDLKGARNVNIELLKAARSNNPDAFIIYKPHPDVASDLRHGNITMSEALGYADRIMSDVDIIDLIDRCDRVETLTSLSGFEALLRGKDVVVHGLPFYAGWGLTKDHTTTLRRTRKRSIDELIYLTLVDYSRYVHPVTMQPCEPEQVIDVLAELRKNRWHKIKLSALLQVARIGEKLKFLN